MKSHLLAACLFVASSAALAGVIEAGMEQQKNAAQAAEQAQGKRSAPPKGIPPGAVPCTPDSTSCWTYTGTWGNKREGMPGVCLYEGKPYSEGAELKGKRCSRESARLASPDVSAPPKLFWANPADFKADRATY